MTSRLWKERLASYGEKAIKIGSNLADVVVHVQAQPSLLTIASVAARALNSYREVTGKSHTEIFRGWMSLPGVSSFDDFIFAQFRTAGYAKPHPNTAKKDGDGDGVAMIGELYGVPVGWTSYPSWVQGPLLPPGQDPVQAGHAIGRFLWETLGPAVVVRRTPFGKTILVRDEMTECLESGTARELYERLEGFLRAGHPRAVLLHGEPGTGKSHMMKHVSRLAGGLSVRVTARSLEHMDALLSFLYLLRPNAVLIDDLDRIEHPDAILSRIEEMRSASLLLCSVNRLDKLDPAVLRAGRFDEVVEVTNLDAGILAALIGDVPEEIASRLRGLPVAYIHEFHRRRSVLGLEQAIDEVESLVKRTEFVRQGTQGTVSAEHPPKT